jgi:hypothetical protein
LKDSGDHSFDICLETNFTFFQELHTMTKRLSFVVGAIACALAVNANADVVTISQVLGGGGVGTPSRSVTSAEATAAANPAPADGDVYQYKVTTDGDILSVGNIKITLEGNATLFQNPLGDASDANKPTAGLEAVFPSITADTWIDTPGAGSRLGPALPGDGTTTVGDLTSDGAVTDFIFAQLTVPHGTKGTFTGQVSIAGGGGTTVVDQPFSFSLGAGPIVPEPATLGLSSLAFMGLAAAARRRK